jgi:hypothetical protein
MIACTAAQMVFLFVPAFLLLPDRLSRGYVVHGHDALIIGVLPARRHTTFDVCSCQALGGCMDAQAGVRQAAGALREALRGDDHVLRDPAAAKALLDVIPTESVTLNELDVAGQRSVTAIELNDEDYF